MLPNRSVDLGVTRTSFSRSESYCSCRDVEYFHDLPHRSANLELWSLSRFGSRSLSTQASIVHEQGNDIESIATWLMGLMPLCEFFVKTIWLSRLAMTLAIQMAFFLILTLASRTSRKIVPTSLLQTILSWTPVNSQLAI